MRFEDLFILMQEPSISLTTKRTILRENLSTLKSQVNGFQMETCKYFDNYRIGTGREPRFISEFLDPNTRLFQDSRTWYTGESKELYLKFRTLVMDAISLFSQIDPSLAPQLTPDSILEGFRLSSADKLDQEHLAVGSAYDFSRYTPYAWSSEQEMKIRGTSLADFPNAAKKIEECARDFLIDEPAH